MQHPRAVLVRRYAAGGGGGDIPTLIKERAAAYARARGAGAQVAAAFADVAAAIAYEESGWNPTAAGDNGHSIGLFQLHDAGRGSGMSVAARQDPVTNIDRSLPELWGGFTAAGSVATPDSVAQTARIAQRPDPTAWATVTRAGGYANALRVAQGGQGASMPVSTLRDPSGRVVTAGPGAGGSTMAEQQPAYATPQNQQQVADLGRQTPATSSRDSRLESFADTRVAELMNKIDELDKRVAELTALSSKPVTDEASKAAAGQAMIELGQLGTTRDNYVNEIKTLYPYTKGAAARIDSPAQQTAAQAQLLSAQTVADKLGIDLAQWQAEFPLKAQGVANQTFGVQTDRLNAMTAMDGNTLKALGEAFGEQSEVMKGYLTLFQLNQTRTNDWVKNQIDKGQMDLSGLQTYVAARDHQQAGEIARAVEELNRAKYISDERKWLAQHTLASNQQPYLDPGAYMQGKLKEAGIQAPTLQLAPTDMSKLDPIKVLSEAKGTLPAEHDDAWWGIPDIQQSRERARSIDVGPRPADLTPADVKMPQPYSLEQIQGALSAGAQSALSRLPGAAPSDWGDITLYGQGQLAQGEEEQQP